MKEAIKIQSGTTVLLIETDNEKIVERGGAPQADGELQSGSSPDQALAKLEEMGSSISLACRSLYGKVVSGMNDIRPAEFTLEFGIKLAGEGGVPMLTKVSGEASIKVTAKWVAGKVGGNV
ncbi:CU044_2847 family protein [Sorangium sp. So ce726]|uniref:CU044_2847 family protein n=1 Tax=Sorangium sp. So ce726 TaxID=3133319 RepID=UPI003F61FC4E